MRWCGLIGMLLAVGLRGGAQECDPARLRYALSPEEFKRQTYLEYANAFDNAWVLYRIGEFELLRGGETLVVGVLGKHGSCVQGSSQQGEDQQLLGIGQTEVFQPAAGDRIRFFRLLHVRGECNADQQWKALRETMPYPEREWVVPFLSVLDRSEWVVQLVRVRDGAVLDVLDSVGVLPTTPQEPWIARPYGERVMETVHERELPPSAVGEPVVVRISPRRWGPTPFGMTVRVFVSGIAASALYRYAPDYQGPYVGVYCERHLGREWMDTLVLYCFWHRLLPYTDSLKATTGCLMENFPEELGHACGPLPEEVRQFWRERYGIRLEQLEDGRQVLVEEGCPEAAVSAVPSARSGASWVGFGSAGMLRISPHSAVAGGTVVCWLSRPRWFEEVEVLLYDALGRFCGLLWQGRWAGQPVSAVLPRSLSPGQYWLVLRSQGMLAGGALLLVRPE